MSHLQLVSEIAMNLIDVAAFAALCFWIGRAERRISKLEKKPDEVKKA